MPWQPADPGTIAKDANGNFHLKMGDQWTPLAPGTVARDAQGAVHFNNDFLAAPAPSGVTPSPGEPEEHRPLQDAADMLVAGIKNIPGALKGMLDSAKAHANPNPDIARNFMGLVHNVTNPTEVLSSVGNTLQNATPEQVGANVVAPIFAGGAASKIAGLAGGALSEGASAVDMGTEGRPLAPLNPYENIGLRRGATGTLTSAAAGVAGAEGRAAVSTQNVNAATRVAGNQAGVPSNVPVTKDSLKEARRMPGQLLDEAANTLPTAPLSPAAADLVRQARGPQTLVPGSPDVENYIGGTEQRLLNGEPISGPEIRSTRNLLSQEAEVARRSDDPAMRAKADYQQGVVRALDQHIEDTLPSNSPFSADQIKLARRTLAQNYTVDDLLHGSFLDLKGLGKLHDANPNLLTGNLRTLGQFAVEHPEVSGLPSAEARFAPAGMATNAGRALGAEGGDIGARISRLFNLPTAATRVLTGPPARAASRARLTPVTGLANEFAPQQHLPVSTGDLTASPVGAPPAPAAGPPGQIPLADLLSHGVEQPPPEGLSLASGASPVPGGIPFARDAAHEAGDLSLADQLMSTPHTYGGADLPHVMSQGVPEDIVARAPQRLANNASLNNPASLEGISAKEEAISRGVKPVSFGADDLEHPMSVHDISRRDLNPAPDSIFIDAKTGQIINSGRMAPRAAQALLARWKAIHGGGGLAGAF